MESYWEFKKIYKHWPFQIERFRNRALVKLEVDEYILKEMESFITERQFIWDKKASGMAAPFTNDPILSTYKFCNIYRELDRQTIEFHTLLKPLEDDFELWLLNIMFCRFVCKPETIRKVGLLSFGDNNVVKSNLLELPSPKYGDAYLFPISVIQKSKFPNREEFFTNYLPLVAPVLAKEIISWSEESVSDGVKKLITLFGFGFKFHLTEILIDVAYQFPRHINLYKRFPIGPGSAPTMKRLNGGADPEVTCESLVSRFVNSFDYLLFEGEKVMLSAENWEGIGCEFRKYDNLKKGNGRKRKYIPKYDM